MKTNSHDIDDILDTWIIKRDEEFTRFVERAQRSADKLGHALIWIKENVPEDNIISLGFDPWGWATVSLTLPNRSEATTLVARLTRECRLHIDYRPSQEENSAHVSMTWSLLATKDDYRDPMSVTITPKSCRVEETGEFKQVPIRRVVCDG